MEGSGTYMGLIYKNLKNGDQRKLIESFIDSRSKKQEDSYMERLSKNWKKLLIIVICCTVLDMFLHALLPQYSYDYMPSYFVENGFFIPAAAIGLAIIFASLAIVLVFFQENLTGGTLAKGFRLGISFGGLWFMGMPGMSVFFGSPLSHELLGGGSDGLSLFVLSLLLGMFVAADSNSPRTKENAGKAAISISLVALFFVLGQYLAFILMSKYPHFNLAGTGTFLWTLALGLWVGVMYRLLKDGEIGDSPIKRALWFGGIGIGINWLLFNLFVLLFVDVPLRDPVILAICNILSVIAAVFVVEKFVRKVELRSIRDRNNRNKRFVLSQMENGGWQ